MFDGRLPLVTAMPLPDLQKELPERNGMSTPSSPPAVTRSGRHELPAYVSNGVIGLRVLDVPLLPGVVLVSGFAGMHSEMQVEAAAEAPYPLAGDISLDGVRLSMSPQLAEFVSQAYDFSNGELTTRFRYSAAGAVADVEVLTVASRERPTIVLQEVVVEVDRPVDLELRALVDTTRILGRKVSRHVKTPGRDPDAVDGSFEWESLGASSSIGVAYITELLGDADAKRTVVDWGLETDLATDYAMRARPGRKYRLRQIACLIPSVMHHDPDHAALRHAARAADIGFDGLRAENRREWDELWRGRIVIDADDPRWQELADAAFFYLNTSVHPSAPSSTSMYGLAMWNDYHYYYGHVMWDIELFGVPPLLLSQPAAARSLLEFRTQTINSARGNAKLHGRRGLQFPWESGPLHGEEASPGAGRASWYEDHVSLDVAWAFAQYAHATGDRRFLAEDASRILYGVADWIASRVKARRGGYDWTRTMGIAERETPSDNDAYTIMAARIVLDEAIDCANRLGHSVADGWVDVRDGLAVRRSPRTGAIMTHDGFHPREEKGATPGPLAGIFPLWSAFDPAVERATLAYYLKLAPDYIGSPMLSPLYGVWACWAGDRRLAARLYQEGYGDLVGGRFLQTLEQSPEKFPETPTSGPFFANIGGFLMGLQYGLPGLRLGSGPPETWPSRPVVLPAGWKSIEIERAWMHQKPARLVAQHGAERAEVVLPGHARRAREAA
jgi:trehalose/maltose hydrolase-like predicted phosphorylase